MFILIFHWPEGLIYEKIRAIYFALSAGNLHHYATLGRNGIAGIRISSYVSRSQKPPRSL